MNRSCHLLAATAAGVAATMALLAPHAVSGDAPIEVFTRSGCGRCAEALGFLEELSRSRPGVVMVKRDVGTDEAARARLEALAAAAPVQTPGVPSFYIRGALLVGWRSRQTTGREIERLLSMEPSTSPVAAGPLCPPTPETPCPAPPDADDSVRVPFLGSLSASRLGLPLFTLALGLLDGFNPCAMWVLLYLLGVVAGVRDRARMIAIGGGFVLTSGLVYFAFMAAWFNVFRLIGLSRNIEVVLGLLALVVATLNLKDAAVPGRGPSLSIPAQAKPGLYARVRRIVHAQSAGAALAGAVALALVVNLFELLCTAGLPAVYTHVLAGRALPAWQHYAYLALYNLAYIFDDGVMVTVAVVTLSRRRLQERGGRFLKGLSGGIMLVLAVLLLFWPRLLR